MEQDVWARLGSFGLMEQLHPGFLLCGSRFPMVARVARAGNVLPNMGTASVSRHHMVNDEVFGLLATVLTDVTVPNKPLLS